MTDIRFLQQADQSQVAVQLDWLLSPAFLIDDGASLQSAMIVALGSDSRADVTDVLPNPDASDRRGWWGDTDAAEIWGGWPVGSRLWLLSRAKITGPLSSEGGTVARAEDYAREAVKPFIDNRIATGSDVVAGRTDTGRIDVRITMFRGKEDQIDLRYADLWTELGSP